MAVKELVDIFRSSISYKKSWRVVVLLIPALPFTALLFYWCHTTNSLALTSFAYLSLFNIGSLLMYLLSVWVSKQKPTLKYSYGFERMNVLAVFTTTILLVLFGINLLKHSMERIFEPPVVTTEYMLLGTCLGLAVHVIITCGITNRPLIHAAEAATPNWLQNILSDLGHSLCSFSPALGRLLLQRLDPIALLAAGGAISVIITNILIDLDELYLADVAGALFTLALICGTMMPLTIYSAKIMLQTAPEHILPLLGKSLREASTLDGVLELKKEHFWTIAFGHYAGSVHVRVKRDANDQEVLTQLTSRLASQLNDLTIQVVKDEWTAPVLPVTPSGILSPQGLPMVTRTPSPSHSGMSTPTLPPTSTAVPAPPHKHSLGLAQHPLQTV